MRLAAKYCLQVQILGLLALIGCALSGQTPSMVKGDGWKPEVIFTVGDTINGYQPVGILDGIGAFPAGRNRAWILVNHELNPGVGYPYSLANGTQLTGARVSSLLVERVGCDINILQAGLAYDVVYDRQGLVVSSAAQVNETGHPMNGFARFCSAQHVRAGTYGFVDDIFFTGEETGVPDHPHGGSEWAIDVANRAIWALPALGRMAWENVAAFDSGNPNTVALLCGDDEAAAPLYLYIGQKNAIGNGSFLDRNGLAVGTLYAWKADNGDLTPQQFSGVGQVRTGTWVALTPQNPAMAGMPGHDAFGWLNDDVLRAQADGFGCHSFSRPEDIHVNPANGSQLVLASTGRGQLYPADNWGTTYRIDMDLTNPMNLSATLTIINDADGLAVPDSGIRNPDNLAWASDGMIYIQEDRSTSPSSLFGAVSLVDASIWQLNPTTGATKRIAVVDRTVVLPVDATDTSPNTRGVPETSGVIDVTDLFDTKPGEVLLLVDVQAHSIRNGLIGGNSGLVEGGQLLFLSKSTSMLRTDSAATNSGWTVEPFATVGDTFNGYQLPGIPDGMGALALPNGHVRVLVTHELVEGAGYVYNLANFTPMRGARISFLDIEKTDCGTVVHQAGLAYDVAYDRSGNIVTNAAQINEIGDPLKGFARFCSAQLVEAGTFGFVDDIFFANEETGIPFHPHGGTIWALDIQGRAIWGLPGLGRGAWENVTALDSGSPNHVAMLLGDDEASAPLYLYIGQKNALGNGSFLDRNGLAVGTVYAWKADNGDLTPQNFNGLGAVRTGTFIPVAVRNPAMAGMAGHDALGYLNDITLRAAADALGCFSFSRPEDLSTDPNDGTRAIFASTGRGQLFPADNWGDLYIVDCDFTNLSSVCATLTIVHDADDLMVPDSGIRNPDNLVWAADGFAYIQEDRSTSPGSLFGGTTGVEASIWQLNPVTTDIRRIAVVDRSVVLPLGSTDTALTTIGLWETSGIIDVTHLFPTRPGEVLLMGNVQAHGITNGPIGGANGLVESGQLFFLSKPNLSHNITCSPIAGGAEVKVTISNGTPGNRYFMAIAAQNVGFAPNGYFFGINITFDELLFELSQPQLFGFLDVNGQSTVSFPFLGFTCPFGITIDSVALELSPLGTLITTSMPRISDF